MNMNIERTVLAFAGFMVLLGSTLAYFISPYWLLLCVFVGLNLLQAAFTRFCPLALMLKKAGLKNGTAFR